MDEQNLLKTPKRIKDSLRRILSNNNSAPKAPSGTNAKGQRNESKALLFLQQQGLELMERNYRCKMGEVDLIMLDNTSTESTLVFVEVRNRKTQYYGSPVETVTKPKQKKLSNTAKHYVMTKNISATQVLRFDIVGITDQALPQTGTTATKTAQAKSELTNSTPIEWVKNAFYGIE